MFNKVTINLNRIILGFLITSYVIFFSAFSVLRLYSLHSEYYDLGIMNQTVYNTSRGRLLELTDPEGHKTIIRTAIHNDVLLTAIAPFYWIYSGPETLLIIQTVVISIGALFIYKISKQNLKDERFSLVFALVYLLYPPLQWSNTFDFHAVTLATTFILALIYFAGRQKYLLSSVFFFLALLGKEQVGLTTALIGLYFYFSEKKRRFGIFLFLSSLAWSIISFLLIIPLSRQGAHFALERYSGITDPFKVAGQLIQFSTTSYLVRLFFPIAFLAVFSPFVAAILPELVINLLSSNFNQRGIIHHYTAVITPVVFIAAIFSAKYIIKRFEFDKKIIAGFLITASLVASYLYSPLPYSRQADTRPLRQTSPNAFDIYSWQKKLSDENIKLLLPEQLHRFSPREKQ